MNERFDHGALDSLLHIELPDEVGLHERLRSQAGTWASWVGIRYSPPFVPHLPIRQYWSRCARYSMNWATRPVRPCSGRCW